MKCKNQVTNVIVKLILRVCMILVIITSGELGGIITVSASASVTAQLTSSSVLVNGNNIVFDAYNINGSNYLKLRDLAFTLSDTEKRFDVGYDNANNAISLTSNRQYSVAGGEMANTSSGNKEASPANAKIYLDNNEVQFEAYNILGNNYFKLRDIGKTFNFSIEYDSATNTIIIDTSKSYVEPPKATNPVPLTVEQPANVSAISPIAYTAHGLDCVITGYRIDNIPIRSYTYDSDIQIILYGKNIGSYGDSNGNFSFSTVECGYFSGGKYYEWDYTVRNEDGGFMIYFSSSKIPEKISLKNGETGKAIAAIDIKNSSVAVFDSKSKTSIKMYDQFPEVPDAGAFLNSTLYEIDGYGHVYYCDFERDRLNDYFKLLIENGFQLVEENRTIMGPTYGFRKGNLNVAIGIMPYDGIEYLIVGCFI